MSPCWSFFFSIDSARHSASADTKINGLGATVREIVQMSDIEAQKSTAFWKNGKNFFREFAFGNVCRVKWEDRKSVV